ncbi:hypothetical protein POJ06DRAFT_273706 [Lipomyces tetrasporus]|uniref:Homeobox domain-containing protein n=1 Tax=Lipomyces tetrasporus TaxID=54092 RepID=A0AAD7QX55_9ASCO|nr:uncharacterized protein POJ06DRAFT_273706 [Lipomyces tetrasporus]KAJ8103122.1 hypothetical protein POJ06DRAFT_273706 [Lipomyces tetrasporus]
MAPFSPPPSYPPPPSDHPAEFASIPNPPVVGLQQSSQAERNSVPLFLPSSASQLEPPPEPADAMSAAYTLFYPPYSSRQQLQMSLSPQPSQLSQMGVPLPLPQFHVTPQLGSIPYSSSSGSSMSPLRTQERQQRQLEFQQEQNKPQLLSVTRQQGSYYPPIGHVSEAVDHGHTSSPSQDSPHAQTSSTPQQLPIPEPQTAVISYYSAARLIPQSYGLPQASNLPGISGPHMRGAPEPESSVQLHLAASQTAPLYDRSHPMHSPYRQQQHFLPQAVGQHSATAPQQGILFPAPESRLKSKRFRLTHAQTRFLLAEFAKQPHPDAAQRERLAAEIPGLSPRQLQVWFQNRRAKLRRLSMNENSERRLSQQELSEQNVVSTQQLTAEDHHSPQLELIGEESLLQQPLQSLAAAPTQLQFIPSQRPASQQGPPQGRAKGPPSQLRDIL